MVNTGDIYAFRDERLGCWNIFQITGFHETERGPLHSALFLDWGKKQLPTTEDFPTLKPLVINLYDWDNRISHSYVKFRNLDGYTHCGNFPPILSGENLRTWGFPSKNEFFLQKLWDEIPQDLREAYKDKNLPNENRRTGIDEKNVESFDGLKKYPRLSTLTFRSYTQGLFDYIKSNPIIRNLKLDGKQPQVLDFRETKLTEIAINSAGVKEIYLGDAVLQLSLYGGVEPDLQIHDHAGGRFIVLFLSGNAGVPKGLDQVRRVNIHAIKEIDLAEVLGKNAEIEDLRLFGAPGCVTNLPAVSQLKKLEIFSMTDLYGYNGADFPPPGDLPSLETLWLRGLPYEAAQTIKKLYKSLDDKSITMARKPEWLAENLNNPFRNWDGDDILPRGYAKKASDIYKKTKAQLTELSAAENPNLQAESEKLCKAFIEAFNKMDKKHEFIDTVLREDIIMALDKLVTEVQAETGAKFDVEKLMETVDSLRDF